MTDAPSSFNQQLLWFHCIILCHAVFLRIETIKENTKKNIPDWVGFVTVCWRTPSQQCQDSLHCPMCPSYRNRSQSYWSNNSLADSLLLQKIKGKNTLKHLILINFYIVLYLYWTSRLWNYDMKQTYITGWLEKPCRQHHETLRETWANDIEVITDWQTLCRK